MMSTDEDYTAEKWMLSEYTEIIFIPLGPIKDTLVSFKEKPEVYFLNSTGAVIARLKPKPLPALQLSEDTIGVLWFWQLGPSRLFQHGNDESGRPGFKSCVLPWHWNQKKIFFPLNSYNHSTECLLQWYNILPWAKVFQFICYFSH